VARRVGGGKSGHVLSGVGWGGVEGGRHTLVAAVARVQGAAFARENCPL
jgi:hypothetical protein